VGGGGKWRTALRTRERWQLPSRQSHAVDSVGSPLDHNAPLEILSAKPTRHLLPLAVRSTHMGLFRRAPDLLNEQRKTLESQTAEPPGQRVWRRFLPKDLVASLTVGGVTAISGAALYAGLSWGWAKVLGALILVPVVAFTHRTRRRSGDSIERPSRPPLGPARFDPPPGAKTYHFEFSSSGAFARLIGWLFFRRRPR
jgi:hypothetical protein